MKVSEQLASNEHPNKENLLPFEILYERYHPRIYRYLRAHLRNDEDAADLTQQVLFQIWMKIGTYQPERGSLTAWVFRIAHHRLVDSYRAAGSAIAWEPLGEITITQHDPEEMIIAAETLAWVQTLLDALSDEERELLALRFAARLQLSEIAAVIGKSEEATRKQLARLLQRLHRHYQQYQQQDLGACGAKGRGFPFPPFLAVLLQVSTPPAIHLVLRGLAQPFLWRRFEKPYAPREEREDEQWMHLCSIPVITQRSLSRKATRSGQLPMMR